MMVFIHKVKTALRPQHDRHRRQPSEDEGYSSSSPLLEHHPWPVRYGSGTSNPTHDWHCDPNSAKDSSSEAVLRAFADMPPGMVLRHLHSSIDGLTRSNAELRLSAAGPNTLSSRKPPSWFVLMWTVVPNPFNFLLAFLAVISVVMPDANWDPFIILIVMILISCILRFWQEYRSTVAVTKLQESLTSTIRVRRRNISQHRGQSATRAEMMVEEKDVVPGDIVILTPGELVPADCLVVESSHLRISQSTLTGESEPVRKAHEDIDDKDRESLFELSNLALMGTSVTSGHGLGLVLRTGDDAFVATIMEQLARNIEPNSFQSGIRRVTYMLIVFMGVMVPIVLVVSGCVTGNWAQAVLFSVSVAVGLVPEMLPAIVNANLARGAFSLSEKRAIVKRLDSIQNLGAMSILCCDKTGTLTQDSTAVRQFLNLSGHRCNYVLQLATIDARIQAAHATKIDTAILEYKRSNGRPIKTPPFEKVAAVPFTFERRRSSSIHRGASGRWTLICKGACEEVLALCTRVRRREAELPLEDEARRAMARHFDRIGSDGFRVLLVATRDIQDSAAVADDSLVERLESRLTLEGIITCLDPPKDDAAASIAQLDDLGVEVKILTGDNINVAVNICEAIGMTNVVDDDGVLAISGPQLARLQAEEFDEVVQRCRIFAKLTPAQKGQIVDSLKHAGNCVGMLGDGINDCVALRRADVGISVDSGAPVAKDYADVILTQKGLDIIVESIKLGRATHANTIKYIKAGKPMLDSLMVASSNFGNVFSILIASAWLPFTPMTGLQLLVQNLLYDLSQVAIPWDKVDNEFLQRPQHWDSMDLFRFIVVLGPTSSVIDILTFCLGWFVYGVQSAEDLNAVKLFQTHWFLQGLLTQTIVVHLLRTNKVALLQSSAARALIISTGVIMAVGLTLPYITVFQDALGFVRPAGSFVGFLFAELVLYCVEVELVKGAYKWAFKAWL